jgi:hypothetical protein
MTACNGLGGIAGSYIVRQKEAPKYMMAICISLGNHALIILFGWRLYAAILAGKSEAEEGKRLIESVEGLRYTY